MRFIKLISVLQAFLRLCLKIKLGLSDYTIKVAFFMLHLLRVDCCKIFTRILFCKDFQHKKRYRKVVV